MKSSLPLIKINKTKTQTRVNRLQSTLQDKKNHVNRYLNVATESGTVTRVSSKQDLCHSSVQSSSMAKLDKEYSALKSNVYIEKIWLIRRIGDLLNEDNRLLSAKQRRIRRKMNKKYKQFNSQSNKLLNLIREQGNSMDFTEMKRLKQTLK